MLGTAVVAGVLLAGGPASASVGMSVSLTMPAAVAVGQTFNGSFTITNINTAPNQAEHNIIASLRLAPSCASGPTSTIPCPSPDPGVVATDTPATGGAGTACAGLLFAVSAPDAAGVVTFSPPTPIALAPPGGPPGPDRCTVNATFLVQHLPTVDSNPPSPGVQTRANFTAQATGSLSAIPASRSTSFEMTVAPPPSLSIGDATVTEGDAGTKLAAFTVTRSGATTGSASVNWYTLNNTATAGTDYVAVPATPLNFNPGETAKVVSVTINGDTAVEFEETYVVRLTNPVGAGITDGSGLGRITNDDSASFSVNDVTVTEGNSGTKLATFTVTRSGDVAGPASVMWSTVNAHATAGSDYVAVAPTTLSFGAGETTKTASATVNGDTAVEPGEDFYVRLTRPSGATILDANGLVRITNDDAASLSVNDVTLTEGNAGTTLATFTISRTGSIGGPASVNWSTANGTAGAPSDYTSVGWTTVTFAPGETAKTVAVTVSGDTAVEANETFQVRLATPVSATIVDGSGLGRITNDDAASLAVNDVTVAEGNSGRTVATFTITRSGATGGTASVQWYTANGTATAPADYVAVAPTTVTFAPGETSKTVSVTVNGDGAAEPNETFSVRLTAAAGAAIADGSGLGRINNDD